MNVYFLQGHHLTYKQSAFWPHKTHIHPACIFLAQRDSSHSSINSRTPNLNFTSSVQSLRAYFLNHRNQLWVRLWVWCILRKNSSPTADLFWGVGVGVGKNATPFSRDRTHVSRTVGRTLYRLSYQGSLQLRICETRKHITCFQNPSVGQDRYSLSKRELY